MYKKDYTPLQSEIYPIDVRLVQLQCNLSYQQTKKENNMITARDAGKVLDKV